MVTRYDGSYLTQREIPKLATLEAKTDKADGETLQLRAGASSIAVPVLRRSLPTDATLFGTSLALVDQCEEVGRWLATALGPPPPVVGGANILSALQRALQRTPSYRLLHAPENATPEPLRGGAGLSDLAPLLLLSEESLEALNARRGSEGLSPVPMGRFRPNLVVKNCPEAHSEDGWSSVTIGEAKFRVVGPCPRCTVPDVEQSSGRRDTASEGPMATLKSYRVKRRQGVLFGVYLAPLNPGVVVRVGDVVKAK
uniref:MOSC domain-containing protein n=1 Tax=Corethron hystrix TaxID=216773 RepID=A0A7S1BCQ4_9STRA